MAKKEPIRLQKYMAQLGLASRRSAEKMIAAGRVRVNGKVVTEMGVKVDPDRDEIIVDNVATKKKPDPPVYILLYKPRYVLSSTKDSWGKGNRRTVLDLVDTPKRLYPVGRLDFESEGLILLTNDGDMTQKLTHPSFAHEREYEVMLDRPLNKSDMRRWRYGGFEVDGKQVGPMQVTELASTGPGWLRVVLKEGRKRHIREVATQLGYKVVTLIRVRFGPLKLGKLKPGKWRYLSPREVDNLHKSTQKRGTRRYAGKTKRHRH